jgi:methylmalonyl-CoA mutase, C-terminal domain
VPAKDRQIRCVLAKVGLDGHQRGVQIVAEAWTRAGYEVIYLGLRNTPEEVASVTVDEDADVVGVSILSGSHLHVISATRSALDAVGAEAVPLIVGGVFPREDIERLHEVGAAQVLGPGTMLEDVVQSVPRAIERARQDGKLKGDRP